MTSKQKGVRVWVAVWKYDGEPSLNTVSETRLELEHLRGVDGINIRRATLTLDPVKPKKRRKP